MYYCEDCKKLIDDCELKEIDEGFYTEVWGSSVYNDYVSEKCPFCGSDKIEEAPRCVKCRQYFVPKNEYDDLCEDCSEE